MALLIITQTAKKPTPMIVAVVTSVVHSPQTLTPHRLRMSSAAISQTVPFITRVKPEQRFLWQRVLLLETSNGSQP